MLTLLPGVLSPPSARTHHRLRARDRDLLLGHRTRVMGVLNVTPDSFSDAGRFLDADRAVERALEMAREGADIIDIGGESTRPGASPVTADEELTRIAPVVDGLREKTDALLSIDTSKASVAQWALDHGVHIINDVTALRSDPDMAAVVAEARAAVILMHMKGTPRTMQEAPTYEDVVAEVGEFLEDAVASAESAGVAPSSILIDPGFGFGKTVEHNLRLLNRLGALSSVGKPMVVGTSRKSFIGRLLDAPVEDRLHGTAASVAAAILRGAHVVRVHDVTPMRQVVDFIDAILDEGQSLGGRE